MKITEKKIKVWQLAKLVADYNDQSVNQKLIKQITQNPETYINFCKTRGLL